MQGAGAVGERRLRLADETQPRQLLLEGRRERRQALFREERGMRSGDLGRNLPPFQMRVTRGGSGKQPPPPLRERPM
jgi:hypothetical protein